MQYDVKMTRKAVKGVEKLPVRNRETLVRLLCDIRDFGPFQPKYSHFSKLGNNSFHCHIGFHWVACWKQNTDGNQVEVYYVGSRESAPY